MPDQSKLIRSRRPFAILQGLPVSRSPRQGRRSRPYRFAYHSKCPLHPFGYQLMASDRFRSWGRSTPATRCATFSCRFLPVLFAVTPLRDFHPSGSWPCGPATLSDCVSTRRKNLQKRLPCSAPRSPFTRCLPHFLGRIRQVIVPGSLTLRSAHCSACQIGRAHV